MRTVARPENEYREPGACFTVSVTKTPVIFSWGYVQAGLVVRGQAAVEEGNGRGDILG